MTEQELSSLVTNKLDQLNQDMVALEHYRESRWTAEDNCKIAHHLELTKYLINSLEAFRELPDYYRVLFMPADELNKTTIPSSFKKIKNALSKTKTENETNLIFPEIIEDYQKTEKIIDIIEDWKRKRSEGVDDINEIISREVPDELKRIMYKHGIGYLNFGNALDLKELLADVEKFEIEFKKAKTIFEKEYNDDVLNRLNVYFSVIDKGHSFSKDKVVTEAEIDYLKQHMSKVPYSLTFLEYTRYHRSVDLRSPLYYIQTIKMLKDTDFFYLTKNGDAQEIANLFLKSSKCFLEKQLEEYKRVPKTYSDNFRKTTYKLDLDVSKINCHSYVDTDELFTVLRELENKYRDPRDTFDSDLNCLYELIRVRDKPKKRTANFFVLNNNINENVLGSYEAVKIWYENFITYIGAPVLGIRNPIYVNYDILRNKEKMVINISDSEKSILKLKEVITRYINIFSNIDSEIKEVINPDFELSILPSCIYKKDGVRKYLCGSYANSKTLEIIELVESEVQIQSNEKIELDLNQGIQKQLENI